MFRLTAVGLEKAGKQILSDITLAVQPGECLVLAGENGAGKSSLLRLFNRLDDPTSGEIRFRNRDLLKIPVRSVRKRIGMVMQGPVLFDGTVRHVFDRVRRVLKRDFSDASILDRVGLPEQILDRKTGDLSGGEIQLITIGLVLERKPDVLLLDEPASALSVTAMERLEALLCDLKASGITMIQVTHHIDRMVDKADRGVFLENGKVKRIGPMSEIAGMFRNGGAR